MRRGKIPVEWVGFFNHTGYGQSATSYVLALDDSEKYDVKIQCIHNTPKKEAYTERVFNRLVHMLNKPDNPNAIQIYHTIPDMHRRVRALNKKIAFVTFETFEPPSQWVTLLNRCDAIFCPSKFNFNMFVRGGVTQPVFHIPHVIDMDIWKDEVSPIREYDEFTFVFSGTWQKRKGYDILLKAWMNEFEPYERVRLVIKTDRTKKAEEDVVLARRESEKKEIAPISFEREIFNELGMAQFLKSADCFICPTLGEGFGLPGMQCMALRVPVITTDFSGCQDYANESNCTLLETSGFLFHTSLDPRPQFRNKKWPRIKVETIQKAMRHVFENYEVAQKKADKAYRFVHDNFGFPNFVSNIDNMMETIYGARYVQTKTIQRQI